ncbi:methyltransferase family protein [Litoreibacter ponti]|uniref:Methyltransferase family protein n=1 Tax=Litoreibacter ponti TaxID=1510457 RepID=A0A2T6BMQ5_9RHOB|nr:class I SAM-dependent methyltransferase [Litoreibacter ponti]PTX57314.1 methyltransferase family protein [Litoreibacter ponti]
MTDKETIDVYNTRATDYTKFARGLPDADLAAFMAATKPGGHVLDLGCGPGNSAAMLQDAGFTVSATDASPEMVRIARETYGVDAQLSTFDDISGTDIYDGIWANFSLLHAPKADMPRHLAALRTALKPGGIFHIGLKVGTGEARDTIGRKYSYYQEAELHDLLNAAGLRPRTTRHGAEPGLDGVVAPFMIVLCDG